MENIPRTLFIYNIGNSTETDTYGVPPLHLPKQDVVLVRSQLIITLLSYLTIKYYIWCPRLPNQCRSGMNIRRTHVHMHDTYDGHACADFLVFNVMSPFCGPHLVSHMNSTINTGIKYHGIKMNPVGLTRERRSTIEVLPNCSEAPNLRKSSIPHPKIDFGRQKSTCIPMHNPMAKVKKKSFYETRSIFRRFWVIYYGVSPAGEAIAFLHRYDSEPSYGLIAVLHDAPSIRHCEWLWSSQSAYTTEYPVALRGDFWSP